MTDYATRFRADTERRDRREAEVHEDMTAKMHVHMWRAIAIDLLLKAEGASDLQATLTANAEFRLGCVEVLVTSIAGGLE